MRVNFSPSLLIFLQLDDKFNHKKDEDTLIFFPAYNKNSCFCTKPYDVVVTLIRTVQRITIKQSFFLPKQSPKSRSILKDGPRSLGLFRKGKINNLGICSHSRDGAGPRTAIGRAPD